MPIIDNRHTGGGGAVDSVNAKTGVVVLGKADIGLPLVDNTPDTGKPVSTAQQAALDLKSDKVNIQLFTSSGTWTKPAGAKFVEVHAISGGGGGGAGRRGAAGTNRNGGGGGAAGSSVMGRFDASLLTSTVTVTIGSGGTGAVSTTVDNTDGAAGVDGGTTTFGTYLSAPSGKAGKGGTATNGLGGVTSLGSQSPWNYIQFGGANASTTGGAGVSPSVQQWVSPNSGASGAGISTADAISTGSVGGAITGIINPMINAAGGLAGGVAPANAGNGTNSGTGPFGGFFIGTGGGSSRSSITTASGNGGDGGLYGGGGGGSGATLNGFATGQGGKGGDGVMAVVTYF